MNDSFRQHNVPGFYFIKRCVERVCDVKVVTKTPCLEKDWKILFRFVKCCFVCFKFIRANRNAFFVFLVCWNGENVLLFILKLCSVVIWIHQWRISKTMFVNQFWKRKKLNIITLLYIHYVYDYDRLSVASSSFLQYRT